MKKQIFRSLFLSTLIIVLTAITVIAVLLNKHYEHVEMQHLKRQAEMVKLVIDQGGEDYLFSLPSLGEGYRITLVCEGGDVVYDAFENESEMDNLNNDPLIKKARTDGSAGAAVDLKNSTGTLLYYATLLSNGDVLRVGVVRDSTGYLLFKLITLGIWVMILVVFAAVRASKRLTRQLVLPLNHVDLNNPFDDVGYGKPAPELKPLLTHIDQQNKKIKEQYSDLEIRRNEFATVTESIGEGLILINKHAFVLSMNPAACKFVGLSNIEGQNLYNLPQIKPYKTLVESVLRGEQYEQRMERNNRVIDYKAYPIVQDGEVSGASILVQDITEQIEAEAMRREFTANVSHDLKTPLQTIMGYGELLSAGFVQSVDDQKKFAGKIYEESHRMLELIDDIIRLSKLDETRMITKQDLNLEDIVKEAVNILNQSASKRSVALNLDLEPTVIKGNRTILFELIYNLIDNAIRYNVENGHVNISTYIENGLPAISVEDTGIGIPKEEQERIFERFYRVDKSHNRKAGGTGLGLSIVRHAVDLSGGTITIDSKVGVGTTFTVVFEDQ